MNSGSLILNLERDRLSTPLTVSDYFAQLQTAILRLPYSEIDRMKRELLRAYRSDRTIFVFGNGGSAATASHMICDLAKGVTQAGKRFRVLSLADNVPLLTAWANDSSYEDVFAQQLGNFVRAQDVVVAISGSGNSPNVLKALQVARQAQAVTLGLTGYQGGRMIELCDVCVVVPCDNMQVIEDLHHSVAHSLFTVLRYEVSSRAASAKA